ncbi:ATP-dependent helicase HrpB [Klebsiella pneumoniae]|uniref:ATP-dependent helicase HrpB n=1 Tax=Klebsiella pneumoniae TaxID=573 RepID=A0A377TNQ7_KLEPN|nr:ATP-dependent helicase HrpB [Klebsiella pneumoniae]
MTAACRTRRSSLPGICLHLLGKEQAERAAAQSEPEILHSDLSALLLELLQWGCHDPAALAWLDQPPAVNLAAARPPAGGAVGAGRRAAVGVWPQNGSAWQRAAAGGDAGRPRRPMTRRRQRKAGGGSSRSRRAADWWIWGAVFSRQQATGSSERSS